MSWKFKYYDVATGINWDALEANCSWFSDMKAVPQDAVWHAEGDVQIHTRMVCEQLLQLSEFIALSDDAKHIMVVGAFMHDIEKRSTTVEEFRDERLCIMAPRHAKKGEYTTRELLYKEFDCPYDTREIICKLVRWHGKPLYSIENDDDEKSLVSIAFQVPMNWLAMLAKADVLGRICDDQSRLLEKLEYFKMMCQELDCIDEAPQFNSELSRHQYLKNGGYLSFQKFHVPYDESKFEVILMSALPGSGKDTYIKKTLSNWPVVSLDGIRTELKISPTDKSGNGKVIQLAKERAKEFMRKHQNFVWNATNITTQMRSQLIELFESYGGKVTIVYIEVPYTKLVSQNKNRDASVPQNVIDRMISKLEPPVIGEAFEINTIIDGRIS